MFPWLKALHIISMVTWFAGLFYLPRLFVYHAMTPADDRLGQERFKVMEWKLFFYITTPGALLTILSGWYILHFTGAYGLALQAASWLEWKLYLARVLVVYHIYCGYLLFKFKQDKNKHSHVFYRWLNEFPTVILIAMVILAVVRPF